MGFFGDKLPRQTLHLICVSAEDLFWLWRTLFSFLPFPRVTCCLEPSRICITHTERAHHGEQAQDVYAHIFPAPTARTEQKHGNASSLGCRRVLLTLSQSRSCLSGLFFFLCSLMPSRETVARERRQKKREKSGFKCKWLSVSPIRGRLVRTLKNPNLWCFPPTQFSAELRFSQSRVLSCSCSPGAAF